jgi:hypothetical protein
MQLNYLGWLVDSLIGWLIHSFLVYLTMLHQVNKLYSDRGFESRQGLGIFLFTTVSRPDLGPTQPHIQWITGALSLGLKRLGSEADHSPPSRTEVKNAWSYTPSWCSAQLKHRVNFIFTFTFRERSRWNECREDKNSEGSVRGAFEVLSRHSSGET